MICNDKNFRYLFFSAALEVSKILFFSDGFLRLIFPQYIKETVYEVFYSRVGQRISVANYWNDPHHQNLYYKFVYLLTSFVLIVVLIPFVVMGVLYYVAKNICDS